VINCCIDSLDNKQVEAKNKRLQLRKFEKDEEARKKRELDLGLEDLKKGMEELK
jgi:hypothetical protein